MDSIVPTIVEEDAMTHTQGFDTIQVTTEEKQMLILFQKDLIQMYN